MAPESDFEDSLDLPTTSHLQLCASGGKDDRGQLVADLAGWLAGWLGGWLVGCLAGLLAVCPAGCLCCLAGSLAVCPACCLAGLLSKFGVQFWGRFLGPVFGTTFGVDFWQNLAPKIAYFEVQVLVPNLAPFLGSRIGSSYIFNRG